MSKYYDRKDELALFASAADAVYPRNPREVEPSPPSNAPDPYLIDVLLGTARQSARRQFIARRERCGRVDGSRLLLDTAHSFVHEAKAMLHLLAHAYDAGRRPRTRQQWRDREVVAVSIAVLVGQRIGLEVDEIDLASFGWWGGHSDRVEELAQRVLVAVVALEAAIIQLTDGWAE